MSERTCPNHRCRLYGVATNLMVCRRCYRATARSIYRPQTPAGDRRAGASTHSRGAPAPRSL